MRVFIAGIMQGSRQDRFIEDQAYRQTIAAAVQVYDPSAEIVDPNELHPQAVDYGDEQARATLMDLLETASQADLVVAYAPRASMGTALEMWEAFRAKVPVVTISPMEANWVIRFLSDAVLPDLAAFQEWVADGGLERLSLPTERKGSA
ncbi:MAG: hypothetical protein JXM73_08940 [Anaerolineae bacterium]|nr:hypothetical protein [Anaerolineae bacterium]